MLLNLILGVAFLVVGVVLMFIGGTWGILVGIIADPDGPRPAPARVPEQDDDHRLTSQRASPTAAAAAACRRRGYLLVNT